MGEAIARFRDMALAIRRICDERHSQPRGRAVTEAAAKKFTKECRLHLLDHEKNGMNYVERYVRGLCRRRDEAERHPEPPPPGHFDLPYYIHWLPEPFAKEEPGYSEVRNAIREAIKEAVKWGSLFPELEARIKALHAAADMLLQYAGAGFHQSPAEKYWCEAEDGKGGGYISPSKQESDSDYIGCHRKFAEALDALAPFIEEPPAPTATSGKKTGGKQAKRQDRKGIGGRPEKFAMKFIREVVAARERDRKHARTSRRPLPPIPRWLSDYCTAKQIDIGKTFPQSVPGEAWSDRANRFWKAATKRLREAETNRH